MLSLRSREPATRGSFWQPEWKEERPSKRTIQSRVSHGDSSDDHDDPDDSDYVHGSGSYSVRILQLLTE
jgi:hypothetical protein